MLIIILFLVLIIIGIVLTEIDFYNWVDGILGPILFITFSFAFIISGFAILSARIEYSSYLETHNKIEIYYETDADQLSSEQIRIILNEINEYNEYVLQSRRLSNCIWTSWFWNKKVGELEVFDIDVLLE